MAVVEVITIIGSVAAMAVGLAVLIIRSTARLDRRIDRLDDKLGERIDGVEDKLGRRIDGGGISIGSTSLSNVVEIREIAPTDEQLSLFARFLPKSGGIACQWVRDS